MSPEIDMIQESRASNGDEEEEEEEAYDKEAYEEEEYGGECGRCGGLKLSLRSRTVIISRIVDISHRMEALEPKNCRYNKT